MRRTPRTNWPLATLLCISLTVGLAGCSDDDGPTAPPADQAPALPDPGLITFDFSFFDQVDQLDQSKSLDEYDHFLNAYLRVALVDVVARLVLTPPVAAFSLALHTPPSPQDDGSWIWIYTHVDGDEDLQIRLRGLPVGDRVDWELRVTAGDLDDVVWFSGATTDHGETGTWTFRDLDDPSLPESGRISWGRDAEGTYLRFACLHGEDAGDSLQFQESGVHYSITHVDAEASQTSIIEWSEDGRGSLTVPDYHDGRRACWDTELRNTVCP